MFLPSRGLGFQRYHSFVGDMKLFGRFFVTGLSGSSTISLAGIGGQLLASKAPPPMNVFEPCPLEISVVICGDMEAEPCSAISHVSLKCFLLGGAPGNPLSHMMSLYCFRFASFISAKLVVASSRKPSLSASSMKNFSASVAKRA